MKGLKKWCANCSIAVCRRLQVFFRNAKAVLDAVLPWLKVARELIAIVLLFV